MKCKQKVLVLGNEGFIGTRLVDWLSINNYTVDCVDIVNGVDINTLDKNVISKYDTVINLAGSTSVWNDDSESVVWNNILGWVHVYNICKDLGIKYIYTSSSCAVNITSVYGLSKRFDDEYFRLYTYDGAVGLRLHNVYGRCSRSDTLLGKCLNNSKVILYNNGQNRRFFTHIDDVCSVIQKCIDGKIEGGKIYNVFCPTECSVLDFVNTLKKYKDIDTVLVSEKRERDKERQIIDTSLENLLSDDCIGVEEGVKKSIL